MREGVLRVLSIDFIKAKQLEPTQMQSRHIANKIWRKTTRVINNASATKEKKAYIKRQHHKDGKPVHSPNIYGFFR